MLLKLKESIIAGGEHYAPPTIIDTALLKISDAEAEVLVRRGTAAHHTEVEAPTDQADGGADLVDGTLAGVVEKDGNVKPLEDLPKADLVKLAADMGLETAGKTKAELVEAIKAEPVFADKAEGQE